MNFINKSLLNTILGITVFSFAFAINGFAQSNSLITNNSAGGVRIGMTVAEARRAMPRHTFRRSSDGEGIALIEISQRNQTHLTVYAGEFDTNQPIDDTAKIEFIEVWNPVYRTRAGVHPQMRIQDAEARYGKVESIMLSEIEAREFARFGNQPAGIDLRVQNRNGMAGIYSSGQTVTTRYSPSAVILSVIVLGGADSGNVAVNEINNTGNASTNASTPAVTYSSRYTDLRTQCQTPRNQGSEGGHVSTYCQGFGGYRLHIFDTATTMEISAEMTDGQKSVHLASQSLSFDTNRLKVEWRIRDEKPFAVIIRASRYQLGEDGLIRYPETKTGEYLVVKGLPGFEHIDYEVDTRTGSLGNPNERARQMADTAYSGDNSGHKSAASYQKINVNRYNRMIDIGSKNRRAWVKSPTRVVIRLVGEMKEMKMRNIRFISPSAEGGDSMTVIVTDNGLLDDSVVAERLKLGIRKNSAGVWKVISGQKAWKCQRNRGHQDFSAVPCK